MTPLRRALLHAHVPNTLLCLYRYEPETLAADECRVVRQAALYSGLPIFLLGMFWVNQCFPGWLAWTVALVYWPCWLAVLLGLAGKTGRGWRSNFLMAFGLWSPDLEFLNDAESLRELFYWSSPFDLRIGELKKCARKLLVSLAKETLAAERLRSAPDQPVGDGELCSCLRETTAAKLLAGKFWLIYDEWPEFRGFLEEARRLLAEEEAAEAAEAKAAGEQETPSLGGPEPH